MTQAEMRGVALLRCLETVRPREASLRLLRNWPKNVVNVGCSREPAFSLDTRAAGDGDVARQKCTASLSTDLGSIFAPGREAGEAPAFLSTCCQRRAGVTCSMIVTLSRSRAWASVKITLAQHPWVVAPWEQGPSHLTVKIFENPCQDLTLSREWLSRERPAHRARRAGPPSRAKVPHVTVPSTRSWVQHVLMLMPRFETSGWFWNELW